MTEQADHCPFLNRSDHRCAAAFNLDHLQHAFKFCFDRYKACPVYVQLVVERRVRQVTESVSRSPEKKFAQSMT